MKFKNKLKNLKVKEKLRTYRLCMIALVVLMGAVSVLLSFLMNAKVHEITDVWSPSLSCVQELNTLTSDYRMKQYGHLVAMDTSTMASYEAELETVDKEITQVSDSYIKLISTTEEKEQYDSIQEQWEIYKQQSEEIMELSRQDRTEEAGVLMVGTVYDTYKKFNSSFQALEEYENEQLAKAESSVQIVFVAMLIIMLVVAVISVMAAITIGNVIGDLIVEPVEQIEAAVISMRDGDFSKAGILTYESQDELGVVEKKLRRALLNLTDYVKEISDELKKIAKGDLTRDGNEITDFLGEFSDIKESLLYILKRFNSTLTEIQTTSTYVASDAEEIAKASQSLSEGASEQASAVEELTATVNTVSDLAAESAKVSEGVYTQVKASTDQAQVAKKEMENLTAEMEYITQISREIENIITAIEDIASQTNLLSLNASIEAARAGEAGKGFAVVADQIGKLASDSAQSAVDTRELINKTLAEIEKGNAITLSTAQSFEQIINDMKAFADMSRQSTENAYKQASALEQVEQGIEQIASAVQNTAASSEENSAISVNLSEKSAQLDDLVKRFKLF